MPKKPSLDSLAGIEPVKPKAEPRPRKRKQASQKWDDRTVRRWLYIDRDLLEAAEAKLATDSEHRFLSGQISALMANWVAGHYDDIHRDLQQ